MTFTQSPYVVFAVLSLALFGAWFLGTLARDAVRGLRDRWRDRQEDLADEDEPSYADGFHDGWWTGAVDGPPLEELPPERSREELGFTGSDRNADDLMDGGGFWHGPHAPPESPEVRQWRGLEAKRERLASAAELEHRAAYEAMGLEYPSGLMARVREAAP